MLIVNAHAANPLASVPAVLNAPTHIGGASGRGDARDIDTYAVAAYDPTTKRYLVVWLSARHASSSSSGFDVYGRLLDRYGRPLDQEFRISDRSTAARGALPSVAAGNGSFAVAWSVRGRNCTVALQPVHTATNSRDIVLLSGETSYHSPHMQYDTVRRQFVLVAVAGTDYLPPALGGANTADCGNDRTSTSRIVAQSFTLSSAGEVEILHEQVISPAVGAFRPHLALHPAQNHYMVVWEDRRESDAAYALAVYGQRLTPNLVAVGDNVVLAATQDYENKDANTTWTARPRVAASATGFLSVWFEREGEVAEPLWSTKGRTMASNGTLAEPFEIDMVAFTDPRFDQTPTGFLDVVFVPGDNEYVVGNATFAERPWGLFSEIRLQRVAANGRLLRFRDGATTATPDNGLLDTAHQDRVGISLASAEDSEILAVYSKPSAAARHGQSFDIWHVRGALGAPPQQPSAVYLPLVRR
ncbi:hypothetical protein [Candidatus Viridilinea mediisalina]|uniref:Uncharacterized protein n=1 Tax=Candidatus Viridilinea mediisalina TaxID=2024553 RepID=A0A2A6RDL0_9CHLR|nr:hypothetical protein [Candidatus Viridilinea mediisalina]PDW00189.1 hypothetical protein CJ255_20955 [Candidatus Viridilinea mediisalina]